MWKPLRSNPAGACCTEIHKYNNTEQKLTGCVEEKLGEWQHEFRPGRATAGLIFTMKMMLEKCRQWNRNKMLFIDLEKAFDRVNRQAMRNTLRDEHYNIPEKIVRVIESIYSRCIGRVKRKDVNSKDFTIETGVRQGDVLSPLLFIIFVDKCMKDIGVGERGKETFVCADDVAVVSDNTTEI